jgi:hypothetical protein
MAPRQQTQKRRLPEINHKLAAMAAAGLVAVIAIVCIQMFGDPAAAGPRRVIELNPSAAFADAQRVPFAEAAAEGEELQQYGLNELPPYEGAETEGASGELRVSVVESSEGATPRPAARPLPRAPLAGLTEAGPNGLKRLCAPGDAATGTAGDRHRHRRARLQCPRDHAGDR